MARPLRIEYEGAWHHVMNRGAARRPVFQTAAHYSMFLQLLEETSEIYDIDIHAFCLMGNHYHLLLRTPRAGLARAMRHLDGVYTQRFNRSTGTDGPLFRGRYRSILVSEDSHLCCVSRYIHLNPSEANVAARPEDYRYSSYRAYLGLDATPSWLSIDETLGYFEPGDSRNNYRNFVESGVDSETRAFYADPWPRPVLGDETFRNAVDARLRGTSAASDPERPGTARVTERASLEAIEKAVCGSFKLSPYDLRTGSRRILNVAFARGAMVLLGREVAGQSLGTVASWAGYRSYAGASKAMARLRAEMVQDSAVRELVDAARRALMLRNREPKCPDKT